MLELLRCWGNNPLSSTIRLDHFLSVTFRRLVKGGINFNPQPSDT